MDKKREMALARPYRWAELDWKFAHEQIEEQRATGAPVDTDGRYTHMKDMVLSIAIITASGCKPVETLIHNHH